MDFKPQIETLLKTLKSNGVERAKIEEDLGYSENYIDQMLAKGGNKRFLIALQKYVLQKTTQPLAPANGNGTTSLTGSMTIQDHIAIIEARRLEAVARAEEIKAMYNAVQQEKGVLYDIIKENLTQLMTNSNKHLAYLEKILLVDRADHETTMDSLDRIEHQPVGSNAKRAGKREFDASKNLRKKDKRSQGGVSS